MVWVYPSWINMNINTFIDNEIRLVSKSKPYTRAHIKKLESLSNPYMCDISSAGEAFECMIKD